MKIEVRGLSSMNLNVSNKLDGGSLELIYLNGKLVQAITRGDGTTGDDITENARKFTGVQKEIGVSGKVSVRGEFLIPREVFKAKYATMAANARNQGNGLAKAKELKQGQDLADIHFVAYDVQSEMYKFTTESEKLAKLKYDWGFETPNWWMVNRMEQLEEVYNREIVERDAGKYVCDGLVVKLDNLNEQNQFDTVDNRPRGQVALKFPPATVVATVREIEWTMGLSGRFCPVAHVEPISLGGEVTLRKVSLHNCEQVLALKVTKGAKILVERAGDVIPHVLKVMIPGVPFYKEPRLS